MDNQGLKADTILLSYMRPEVEEIAMSDHAIDYFCKQVTATIDRCRQEWDISYCEIIGCIEIIKNDLLVECNKEDD